MTIQSILLFLSVESADPTRGPAAYAVNLAKAHSARLTLFTLNLDVVSPGLRADPVTAMGTIRETAQAAGVDCQVVAEHSHAIGVHEVIVEHARLHDITIAGSRTSGLLSERIIAENLLFDSGRPVLVVPMDHQKTFSTSRCVVAWDNTRAAARALGDARSLLGENEAILLTIDGDKQLEGDLTPDEVISVLERRGIRARNAIAKRGDRTIADALQDEAIKLGAELLVMGGYGHSRLRRFVLGSATAGILEEPRLPVLMSH